MSTNAARAPVRDTREPAGLSLLPIVGNPRYCVALLDDGVEVGRFADWLIAEQAKLEAEADYEAA